MFTRTSLRICAEGCASVEPTALGTSTVPISYGVRSTRVLTISITQTQVVCTSVFSACRRRQRPARQLQLRHQPPHRHIRRPRCLPLRPPELPPPHQAAVRALGRQVIPQRFRLTHRPLLRHNSPQSRRLRRPRLRQPHYQRCHQPRCLRNHQPQDPV